MNGYIKLHRSILDWEWYGDANTFCVFTHILLCASFSEKHWRGIVIMPGQLVTSISSISKKTGVSIQAVRTSLSKLKSTGEITNQSTSQYRVITVVNWAKYQSCNDSSTSESTSESTNDQQTSNKRATSEQQHRKKDKNIRKKEGNKETLFDAFWEAYPKKVAKRDAQKAWDKINATESMLGVILEAIKNQKAGSQWQKEGGQYIPLPATWINGSRWDDEVQQNTGYTGKRVSEQQYSQREYDPANCVGLTEEEISEALLYTDKKA